MKKIYFTRMNLDELFDLFAAEDTCFLDFRKISVRYSPIYLACYYQEEYQKITYTLCNVNATVCVFASIPATEEKFYLPKYSTRRERKLTYREREQLKNFASNIYRLTVI